MIKANKKEERRNGIGNRVGEEEEIEGVGGLNYVDKDEIIKGEGISPKSKLCGN